jgi:hypothetical protein
MGSGSRTREGGVGVEEGGGQAGMVEHELAVMISMAREGVVGYGGGLEHHGG